MTFALQAHGITKKFPGVLANDQVNFDLARGEIHGLLGENGAGKTTLMNILYGLYQPDAGEILLDSHATQITSPHDAIQQGIGMVHQHFMLVPPLTVIENIILGQESLRGATKFLGRLAVLDRARAAARIRELSHQYGLEVDPDARVQDLPVGAQQRVEIVKALYRDAKILILDEPTAVLTPQEADDLFKIMRGMIEQGRSLIFITHKLREMFAVTDRVSVMRGGKMVGTTTPQHATSEMLAEMMVGRKVILQIEKSPAHPNATVLQVENLQVEDERHAQMVDDVSFFVRAGEILGIAGVQGNGQRELVEALTGLRPVGAGKIFVLAHDVTHKKPRQVIEYGVAHVPEDRHKHGLVLTFPVADNLVLCTYYQSPFARGIEIDAAQVAREASKLVGEFDIRTPSTRTNVGSLSGGNQQKVIVARELDRPVKLLIVNQPTRGLDVGSIEFIHRRIVEARDRGTAVLLVSAELDEILSLADRIAVMYKGRLLETLDAKIATREQLGLLMAGVKEGAHV
ncbi:MAG: ABC transporter ATP-binding protein [Chloroflexi bacterium]|nr:ABC transporter ATP-binding protein [Chloroflexota bacterium]